MSFDRSKAASTAAQLDLAESADFLYELVRDQLEDEDPGVIDWGDIVEMLMGSPAAAGHIQRIIQLVGESGGGIGLAALLAGCGSSFINDNVDDFAGEEAA